MPIIPIYYGFRVNSTDAIDTRFQFATEAARLAISPFFVYEGLITYQVDTEEVWVLKDATDPSLVASWTKVGNVEFGEDAGEVATWAQGNDSTIIPSNKLPSQANFSDVNEFATVADRNASVAIIWHQGDVALITGDTFENNGLYFYTGTDQSVAGLTTDTDFTKLAIAGTDLGSTPSSDRITITSTTGENVDLVGATTTEAGIFTAADFNRANAPEFVQLNADEQLIRPGFCVITGIEDEFWVNISTNDYYVDNTGFSIAIGGTKTAFTADDNAHWRLITDPRNNFIPLIFTDSITSYAIRPGQIAVVSNEELWVNRQPDTQIVTDGFDFGPESFESNNLWFRISSAQYELPTQSDSTNGQFLQSVGVDGTEQWADVDAFPDQADNAGNFLTTNGTETSWAEIDQFDVHTVTAEAPATQAIPAGDIALISSREWYLNSGTETENVNLTTGFSGDPWIRLGDGGGVTIHELTDTNVNVLLGEIAYISDDEWYINNGDGVEAANVDTDFTDTSDGKNWVRLGVNTNDSERVGVVQLAASPVTSTVPSGYLAIADNTQTLIYKNINTVDQTGVNFSTDFTDATIWLKVVDANAVDLNNSERVGIRQLRTVTDPLDGDTVNEGFLAYVGNGIFYKNISGFDQPTINANMTDFTATLGDDTPIWLEVVNLPTATNFGTNAAGKVSVGTPGPGIGDPPGTGQDLDLDGINVNITGTTDVTIQSGVDTGDFITLDGDTNIDGTINFVDGTENLISSNSATFAITVGQPTTMEGLLTASQGVLIPNSAITDVTFAAGEKALIRLDNGTIAETTLPNIAHNGDQVNTVAAGNNIDITTVSGYLQFLLKIIYLYLEH